MQKNMELKKHVATIHMHNSISLVQRKIVNALLFNAYDELLTKDEHEIHIAELCKMIGFNSNAHQKIKTALINLIQTVIEWNLIDKDKISHSNPDGIWNASSILADASIDGPIVNYSYSNKMRKLLYRPEMYGKLNMIVQSKFKSSFGLALYENCIRFQNLKKTPQWSITQFKKLMGVDEHKYRIFRDFRKKVIEMGIKEVNEHSNLNIDVEYSYRGKRSVIGLRFKISTKSQNQHGNLKSEDVFKILIADLNLDENEARQIVENYSSEYIKEKIEYMASIRSKGRVKISNNFSYLKSLLENNYRSKQLVKPTMLSNWKEKNQNVDEDEKMKEKKLKLAFAQCTKLHIEQFVNTLPLHFQKVYAKEGIENPIILREWKEFFNKLNESAAAFECETV